MYELIIKLMIAAALLQLGISVSEFKTFHSRQCIQMFGKKSRDILQIDWKPISMFPPTKKSFEGPNQCLKAGKTMAGGTSI